MQKKLCAVEIKFSRHESIIQNNERILKNDGKNGKQRS